MTPMTITPMLRDAAELKIDEFNHIRQGFICRYGMNNPRPTGTNLRGRVASLVSRIQRFDSHLEEDDDLTIITNYIKEDEDGECISDDKLARFEEQLWEKLRKQANRFDVTLLHVDLMKAAMESEQPTVLPSTQHNSPTPEDEFDVVDNGLEDILERFEAETFTTDEVDIEALVNYLEDLMRSSDNLRALRDLRESMDQYGGELLRREVEIEEDELEWCIMDLLKNDLISSEKRKTLESYLQNSAAMKELLGVLNLRNISRWNGKAADKVCAVVARQDSEGQYHIVVEESLVDMLFLHCTAVGWAQKLKGSMTDFIRCSTYATTRHLSLDSAKQREFFLDRMPREYPTKEVTGSKVYRHSVLPAPPPPPPAELPPGFCVLSASQKRKKSQYPRPFDVLVHPPPPPPMLYATLERERRRKYQQDFFMSRLPTQDGCRPNITPREEVQSNLIKTLATEVKLRMAFDGQYGCSVFDFHSLTSALPHQTILVILGFIGVPERFINFFAQFLTADMNLGPSVRGTPDRILTRACGVPGRHGLQLLFTEAVMFIAELAVIQKTGVPLYRLGDKCYFIGTQEQRSQAANELSTFSLHTQVEFVDLAVNAERFNIGFLELAADTVTINTSMVETYAQLTKKQLSSCTHVYDWVRVWNNTVGSYASNLFGPLVEVFGQAHHEAVKSAHRRIFDIVLEGYNLTDYVKLMLQKRSEFARSCSPLTLEAVIYLPRSLGGLGVKNPFVTISLARNMNADPNNFVENYLDVEAKYYDKACQNWAALEPEHISKKLSSIFENDEDAITAALGADCAVGTFLSKEDFVKHREYAHFPYLSHSLLQDVPPPPPLVSISNACTPHPITLYNTLLSAPAIDSVATGRAPDAVRNHESLKRWDKLPLEDRWVLQMYGNECFEAFGSLEMWFQEFVPMYCMTVIRGGILGDDDDDESSYMTSVA